MLFKNADRKLTTSQYKLFGSCQKTVMLEIYYQQGIEAIQRKIMPIRNTVAYDTLCHGGICHSGESRMNGPLFTVAIEIQTPFVK